MVIINGNVVGGNLAGRNIVVSNGKVVIDGVDVTPGRKQITIEIHGNVEQVKVDSCERISITGDAGSVNAANGDVEVGGNVNGNITTNNGDVDCENVVGDVRTNNGDIKYKMSKPASNVPYTPSPQWGDH